MTHQPVRRRTLVQGSAWLVPAVTVGALAPHAAATPIATCPSPAPVIATGSLTVPEGVCGGAEFSGDFTFSITSPTAAYNIEVVGLEASALVLAPPYPWGPFLPIVGTWSPTGVQTVAPGTPISGGGNIPNIPAPQITLFQAIYVLTGSGLPPAGCQYSVRIDYSEHCQ